MDKKVLIGIIGEKLEIIQEQFAIIKEYDGKIPAIEIDLLMSNIRDLYELFITLQQENQGIHASAPAARPEPVFKPPTPPPPPPPSFPPEEDAREPVAVAEENPRIEPEVPSGFRSPAILGFEPVIERENLAEHAYIPPAPEPEMESESEPDPMPGPHIPPGPQQHSAPPVQQHTEPHETRPNRTTFDLFSEGSPGTLADRFKDMQEKRVADRLSENKNVDLRSTIGINDKFLFINELFDGNMRIYDEAVKKLNECLTMAQADLLLLDLKIVYNWDSESPTVKKFVELVRRKF